jgi:hypothetical protein
MSNRRGAAALARQVAVTLLVLGLYLFARRIPLPGIDLDALAEARLPVRIHLLTAGLTPWIVGFLLVEAFSYIPGTGLRLRRGGRDGRRVLDRAALVAGLILAFIQVFGVAASLESWISPVGVPLVPAPGWGFRAVFVATLVAASVALFWLGQIVSQYGLGNGYSLLLLTEMLLGSLSDFRAPGAAGAAADLGGILVQLLGALAVGALFVVYLRKLEAPARAAATGEAESREEDDLDAAEGEPGLAEAVEEAPEGPRRWAVALPQSVLAVVFAGVLLRLSLRYVPALRGLAGDPTSSLWAWVAGQVVLVSLLSWPLFLLFSGKRRLAAELPVPAAEAARRAAELARRFWPATGLLLAGSAGLVIWSHFFDGPWSTLLDVVRLTLLIAIVWDLASQWRFTAAQGPTACLGVFHNVHLAPLLVERLEEAGIPATLQGFRHRSIFFGYLALVRIGVLVPEARLEEARVVLERLEIRVV